MPLPPACFFGGDVQKCQELRDKLDRWRSSEKQGVPRPLSTLKPYLHRVSHLKGREMA